MKIIESLVRLYGTKTQSLVENGVRPAVLQCEDTLGRQCSALFLQDITDEGLGSAVAGHQKRCPKGSIHALKALGWSALFALSPFSASSRIEDPCCPGDPTAADPCRGNDPISQDIANCDC